MQARRTEVPIAMTGNAMVGDRDMVIEAGMNDYLAKPMSDLPVPWSIWYGAKSAGRSDFGNKRVLE